MFSNSRFFSLLPAVAVLTWLAGPIPEAKAQDNFGSHSLAGRFVFSLDGAFSSAPPPPFGGVVLQFRTVMIGTITLDGGEQLYGESTLAFHHPDIPYAVRSRKVLRGSYSVAPNGHFLANIDEYSVNNDGVPDMTKSSSFVLECYVVRRQVLARCAAHTLISFQQGPEPRMLPMTMSGSLEQQN